jgi:hypothetical protein
VLLCKRQLWQKTALLNIVIAHQTAQKVPDLRDASGPPHRAVPREWVSISVDSWLAQNAYIMRTKCAQKRICYLVNDSTTTTYNFDTLKCTHFLAPVLNPNCSLNLNRARRSPFSFGEKGQDERQTTTVSPCALASPHLCVNSARQQTLHTLYATEQDRTNSDFVRSEHSLPTTYDGDFSQRSIFPGNVPANPQSAIVNRKWNDAF